MNGAPRAGPAVVILVVEDDFLIRQDMANYLGASGYAVLEAESGESAIAMCAAEHAVDILLTDINLGGSATGWDVADTWRLAYPNVGVIYTSGKSDGRKRGVARSMFCDKPCRAEKIIDACRQVLGAA